MYAATIKRPPRTLLEVFQGLPEGTLAQLVENNIVMSPSPLFRHQKVLDQLYRQLGNFVEKHDLGQTLVAPMDVFLDEKNVFQPDILFIGKERHHLIEEDGIHGAPDLVIEILSPSTAHLDKKEKKAVYERCGVREYWLVDPATGDVQGFFNENDNFKEIGKNKGKIHSALLKNTFVFTP